MEHSIGKPNFSIARFAPDLEPSFQADYYAFNLGNFARGRALHGERERPRALPLSIQSDVARPAVSSATNRVLADRVRAHLDEALRPPLATVHPCLLGGAMAIFVLGDLAYLLGVELNANTQFYNPVPTGPQKKFYFVMRFAILMVSLSALRLQFRPALAMRLRCLAPS